MAPAFARWPLLVAFASLAAVGAAAQDVATYRNERHGFSLTYPAGTFVALAQETESLKARAAARVLEVRDLPEQD